MQIAILPGWNVTVTTPTGVLNNVLSAGFLGSLTALLLAAAGCANICAGYLLGSLYGCLLGIIFARFLLRDPAKGALYDHMFQHILRHLPSRKASAKRFMKAFFRGCECVPFLLTVQSDCDIRTRLAAIANAIFQLHRTVADFIIIQRYLLLADSFTTHAPPAAL